MYFVFVCTSKIDKSKKKIVHSLDVRKYAKYEIQPYSEQSWPDSQLNSPKQTIENLIP